MNGNQVDQMWEFVRAWKDYDMAKGPAMGMWLDTFPPIRSITPWGVEIYVEMTDDGPRAQARRRGAPEGERWYPWRATFEEVYADAEDLRQALQQASDLAVADVTVAFRAVEAAETRWDETARLMDALDREGRGN